VYICNYGGYYLNSKKDIIMGPRTIFLGILSTAFKNIEWNFLIDLNSEIFNEESEKPYLDLGVVIKSQTIMDLIKNYLEISEDQSWILNLLLWILNDIINKLNGIWKY